MSGYLSGKQRIVLKNVSEWVFYMNYYWRKGPPSLPWWCLLPWCLLWAHHHYQMEPPGSSSPYPFLSLLQVSTLYLIVTNCSREKLIFASQKIEICIILCDVYSESFFHFFLLALPHTSSYSLMIGGFGGASIQKAQSLIDLGSSRYEYLKLPTF